MSLDAGQGPRTEFEAKKINQRCNSCMTNLVRTVYNVTRNHRLMCMIRNLPGNRRFFVELEGIRSRWRSQRNGLPQDHFSSTYTQTTSLFTQARAALCMQTTLPSLHIAHTLHQSRKHVLTLALVGLSQNYTTNQLRAIPTNTQVSLFRLRNRDCGKQYTKSSRRQKRKSEQETTSSAN